MADQQVCNVNFFVYIKFVFGFYHEFHTSERGRWLAKFYSFIIYIFVVCCTCNYYYNIASVNFSMILLNIMLAEYMLFVLISLRYKNEYLLQYCRKNPLIDEPSNAKKHKLLSLYLIIYLFVLLLSKIAPFILAYYVLSWDGFLLSLRNLVLESIWFGLILARVPLLIIFALLYSRVNWMRKTLKRKNFDCKTHGKHHPRQYIQIYNDIFVSLEKIDEPLKLQLFAYVVLSASFFVYGSLHFLDLVRNYEYSLYILGVIWFVIEPTFGCSSLFMSAILSDMTTTEVEEMLGIILERRIACKSERDRAEIQKLLEYMRSHPFKYTLWRVVPLNMRCLLTFVSFSITTIIAILQISALNN